MRQFVLQGLPTTRTRTSLAAFAAIAWPWGLKMPPLTLSRSPRSMPALRGIEPTSSAQLASVEGGRRGRSVASMPASSGKAQSSSSMTTPSSAFIAGSISSRRSTTGVSGPSSWPDAMRNSS